MMECFSAHAATATDKWYNVRAPERLNDFTILLEILMPLKKIA